MASDLLVLEFDKSPKYPSEIAVSVVKEVEGNYKVINVFTGEEARELYQKLIKLKGE